MADRRRDLSWQDRALCKGMGLDLDDRADPFFPERGMPGRRTAASAIAVCHRCPVEGQCLEWALSTNERYGIWGGKSERDRRRMRVAEFTQLELLPPLEREPRRRHHRWQPGFHVVRSRRRVDGQLALWWSEVLDDERFGIWGPSASGSSIHLRVYHCVRGHWHLTSGTPRRNPTARSGGT